MHASRTICSNHSRHFEYVVGHPRIDARHARTKMRRPETRVLTGWGNYPRAECEVLTPESRREVARCLRPGGTIARGLGRSYGDPAINAGGAVVVCTEIDHFIQLGNEEHDKQVKGVSAEVRRKLVSHAWPGNVRELKSTLESMLVLAQNDLLDIEDLPDEIRGSTDLVPVSRQAFPAGITMQEGEKLLIQQTLQQTGGNREQAAKVLNIGARTLYRKLKEYGLS